MQIAEQDPNQLNLLFVVIKAGRSLNSICHVFLKKKKCTCCLPKNQGPVIIKC